MRGAFKIGKLAGIEVFIHWTFSLLLLYVAFSASQDGAGVQEIVFSLALVLAIFACVTLHEFGHALAARRYGIKTRDIILLPIGGVARLENMPVNPWQEIVVAVAGPLVNVLIVVVIQLIFLLISSQFLWQLTDISGTTLQPFLLSLAIANLMLVLFNAIPAFPMDGGRVLRATLSFFMSRPKATNIAAAIGQLFAVLFAMYGIYVGHYWLLLTALFVYWAASSEAEMVTQKARMEGLKVRNAMRTKFAALYLHQTLQEAIDELLAGADTDFVVCDEHLRVVGILTRRNLVRALSEGHEKNTSIAPFAQTNIPVLMPEHSLHEVYMMMQDKEHNLLPVVENGHFVGVIDLDNIAEFMLLREVSR